MGTRVLRSISTSSHDRGHTGVSELNCGSLSCTPSCAQARRKGRRRCQGKRPACPAFLQPPHQHPQRPCLCVRQPCIVQPLFAQVHHCKTVPALTPHISFQHCLACRTASCHAQPGQAQPQALHHRWRSRLHVQRRRVVRRRRSWPALRPFSRRHPRRKCLRPRPSPRRIAGGRRGCAGRSALPATSPDRMSSAPACRHWVYGNHWSHAVQSAAGSRVSCCSTASCWILACAHTAAHALRCSR